MAWPIPNSPRFAPGKNPHIEQAVARSLLIMAGPFYGMVGRVQVLTETTEL